MGQKEIESMFKAVANCHQKLKLNKDEVGYYV